MRALIGAAALLSAVIPNAVTVPSAAAQEGRADAAVVEEPAVSLVQLAVCTDVQDREPVGEAEAYRSDVGALYCFTWVETTEAPTQVYHRWYVGDKLVNEIPINVRAERWRCWSRKTILPRWNGTCRVEIASEEGDILGSKEFTLTAAE